MKLDAEQQHVLNAIRAGGRRNRATPMEEKAAVAIGLVESGLRNLPGGDADSAGWRQERASLYRDPTNLKASVDRVYEEMRARRGKYGNAGDLAAAVQRPAAQYRGRYAAVSSQAQALLGSGSTAGSSAPSVTTTTTSGPSEADQRLGLLSNYLSMRGRPGALAALGTGLAGVQAPTTTTTTTPAGGRASFDTPPTASGVAKFEGKQVAAWIAPALRYARQRGWKGQVNSGYRSFAEQTRIYNSGVRPAAKPGTSNHEGTAFPRGAIDVSDAQTLARILAKSPYASRLKWAGAKDPVHFSHPHNGSY